MRTQVVVISSVAMAGVLLFGDGVWIFAKAKLAQILLNNAWERTLDGERHARPWRWSTVWPLASIAFPRHAQRLIVLAGGKGGAALGPEHIDGTAMPGEIGNSVISTQRDLRFTVLSDVDIGDEVVIETREGETVRYRVRSIRTVNQRDTSILRPSTDRRLTLVASYPPPSASGSGLRYAVVATAT